MQPNLFVLVLGLVFLAVAFTGHVIDLRYRRRYRDVHGIPAPLIVDLLGVNKFEMWSWRFTHQSDPELEKLRQMAVSWFALLLFLFVEVFAMIALAFAILVRH